MRRFGAALLAAFALGGAEAARAADFFADSTASLLRTDTLSVEVLGGYATGDSHEYVYNPDRSRLSELKWDVANAAVIGGRVAYRPVDWLTLRVRGWATVAADSKIRDYDWLAGFTGFNSYTDLSVHPDTLTPQLWSGDISAAVAYYQDQDLSLTVIGGFRHYEAKFVARGGNYRYSTYSLGDTVGSFPAGEAVGTYRQTWDSPYLGLGTAYAAGEWTLSGELVVSPFVEASAVDNHLLRTLNIKSKLGSTIMFGLSAAAEYRMTDTLSLVGRFDYQRFSEAQGSARYTNTSTGEVFYNPKPGSGADAETAILTLGLKARL